MNVLLDFNKEISKTALLFNVIFISSFGMVNEIHAACLLKDSIFKDQKGEVARISNIKECFGWYNRDEPDLSADGTCFLASEAQKKVDEQSKEYNTRLVGQRVFNLDYKKRTYIIEEDVTVGVPWLHYSVNEINDIDTSKYKSNENEINLMSADNVLDFTLNSDITKADAKKYYNKLLGLKFSNSGCPIEDNKKSQVLTESERKKLALTNEEKSKICYKNKDPYYKLNDPMFCLGYSFDFGQLTGAIAKNQYEEIKKGLDLYKKYFPIISDGCNTDWDKSPEDRYLDGQVMAATNYMMIAKGVEKVSSFKDKVIHCNNLINYYADYLFNQKDNSNQ